METHGVTVRSVRALRGPNVFAYMPVLHIMLDVGPYEDRPTTAFPGFADRITSFLPGLHSHECGSQGRMIHARFASCELLVPRRWCSPISGTRVGTHLANRLLLTYSPRGPGAGSR